MKGMGWRRKNLKEAHIMPLCMHRWFSICNHRAYRAKTGTQKTFKPRWKGDISTKHKVFNLHVSYSASLHMHACSVVSDSLPPMDWSPPGSSVHEISQASILEWVVISSYRGSSWPRNQTCISCIEGRFFTTEPGWKHKGKLLFY